MKASQLASITSEKLNALGYPPQNVSVEFEKPNSLFGADDPLEIELTHKGVSVLARNLGAFSDETVTHLIMHRASQMMEKIDQFYSIYAVSTSESLDLLYQKIHEAYFEYSGGKRMIEVFGQEMYDQYRESSALGLCDLLDQRIRRSFSDGEKYECIMQLFREQAKDFLVPSNKRYTPSQMDLLFPKLQYIFDYTRGLVDASERDFVKRIERAETRNTLLAAPAILCFENISIVESYERQRRIFLPEGFIDIRDMFASPLTEEQTRHLTHIQNILLDEYDMSNHVIIDLDEN